jgi:hypothetical protein
MSWPKTPIKHGHAKREGKLSPTYRTWQAMLTRCTNPKSKSYINYGARGIKVCNEWVNFETFLSDMGERPEKHYLERIDNNKGYSPHNCKWATRLEQNSNTRANYFVVYNGEKLTQAEFSRKIKLNQSTVSYRLRAGWTIEEIVTIPAYTGNRVASKVGDTIEIPNELLD